MTPYFETSDVTIYQADSRVAWKHLPEHSVDAIVTSPPYFGLRDYGVEGQVGLEDSPQEFIDTLVDLLTGYGERALKPGGSLWLNLGDTYNSSMGWPAKSLLMIPERVALALIGHGWILRNRVVWAKPNGMPSSAQDRLATKHEALFHLVRHPNYYYNLDAIRDEYAKLWDASNGGSLGGTDWAEGAGGNHNKRKRPPLPNPGGKNPGDVWMIPTQPYPDAHFAVFPPELVRRPILATVPEGGTVLDPFFGSGTTAIMARKLGRKAVGVELSPDYCDLAAKRFRQDVLDFGGAS